ncbi:uncharacterized protein LOC120996665 [Bufo bufo]|uniref:uncharacterized protein LOC120996665 n=1 Tax=Bufo bufo TaxID=8384 RepID=UPI001ABE6109|nr:uncharacterized protein LOC120996665 [Bufo bufo]
MTVTSSQVLLLCGDCSCPALSAISRSFCILRLYYLQGAPAGCGPRTAFVNFWILVIRVVLWLQYKGPAVLEASSSSIFLLNDPPKMDRKEISRRILDFTLEIISLLSGEDYTIVKKTSGGNPNISELGGWSRTPITELPPLIHEHKILELTHKMMELLTGEVPVRCQDVAVYFSMEEWKYLEGHEDLYKEAMMEDPRTQTSQCKKRHVEMHCMFLGAFHTYKYVAYFFTIWIIIFMNINNMRLCIVFICYVLYVVSL